MPATPCAAYNKRREHHTARAHGRRRGARKDGIGSKGQQQQPPLKPTREARLLQDTLNHKPHDGKMAARDGDKMCRSRYRKPVARRLGAQLGRTTADNTGYERTRRVGRRRDGRKQPISQPKQRPRKALIDRHQPDDLHFSKLASKHARAPIRIVLKARNSTDSTYMRTGVELAIARQPHLTQTIFALIRIAGIGVRIFIDGRVAVHNKLETARSPIIQCLRST